MPRWTLPSSYSSPDLLLILAAVSVGFAWISFNLVGMAMENASFLTNRGLMAVAAGGLVQLLVLVAKGVAALVFYLVFRGAEQELLRRWTGPGDRD